MHDSHGYVIAKDQLLDWDTGFSQTLEKIELPHQVCEHWVYNYLLLIKPNTRS